MTRRLADPARQPARVAAPERLLELLDPAAVLAERRPELVGVLEEDVDPDARVRAGHPRHVAQRPAGRGQRLVAVDAHGAGVVQDDVGEGVRQVAREREETVVRGRVDRDRHRAQGRDEPVQQAVALGLGLGDRRQEPGRAREELVAAVHRAARLRAADGVAADEAGAILDRGAEGRLRRADVRHRRTVARRGQRLADPLDQRGHRRRDDDQVGVLDGGDEALGRLVESAALRRDREELRVGVVAGHQRHAGALRGQADRGADQPGADDGELLEGHCPSAVCRPAGA